MDSVNKTFLIVSFVEVGNELCGITKKGNDNSHNNNASVMADIPVNCLRQRKSITVSQAEKAMHLHTTVITRARIVMTCHLSFLAR